MGTRRHTRPKYPKTRKSNNPPQTQRGGAPNGDSKSARHSEKSQRENGREFPPFEAQEPLAVRRRTTGGKSERNQSLTSPEPEIDSFSPDHSTGVLVIQRGQAGYLSTGTE